MITNINVLGAGDYFASSFICHRLKEVMRGTVAVKISSKVLKKSKFKLNCIFMETVKVASLGQITDALFQVGE